MNRTEIIVFLKNFQKGHVKTRLAHTMGDEKAMSIYRELCDYTIQVVRQTGLPCSFYFSDYIDEGYLHQSQIDLGSGKYRTTVQSGKDLGMRMYRAFRDALTTSQGAIIIGTDCPYLDRRALLEAENLLHSDQTDVVIGPAYDGGYYALGMKSLRDIFHGIHWSTSEVLDQTVDRIREQNLRYIKLPVLADVDLETDWRSFLSSPSAGHFQEVIRASSSSRETPDDL